MSRKNPNFFLKIIGKHSKEPKKYLYLRENGTNQVFYQKFNLYLKASEGLIAFLTNISILIVIKIQYRYPSFFSFLSHSY